MNKKLVQYAGHLNSEVRLQLLDLVKVMSLANLGERSDLKRLCNIAIELLDNAQRYSSARDVAFQWHVVDQVLMVEIRNRASREDAERLLQIVGEINAMTAAEIATAFRAQLTNEQFGDKGGAGLGMLQIAKRTGARINATLEQTTNEEFLCTSEVAVLLS
ncbi:MAG TPA: DUF6272 family protein [Flavobacteriales bacterium]|nr:DUF6272 family protein [Flavobacteriales bacterium]